MPQNIDLKGISFEFLDQNLEIWMHESNGSALPSASRMAKRGMFIIRVKSTHFGFSSRNFIDFGLKA